MHGLGNDYLYVYGEVPANIEDLSKKLSERHFGAQYMESDEKSMRICRSIARKSISA